MQSKSPADRGLRREYGCDSRAHSREGYRGLALEVSLKEARGFHSGKRLRGHTSSKALTRMRRTRRAG